LSSGSQKKRTEVLEELAHELRQCSGLGASFFRAAAARIEMADTDMQVIDLLDLIGPLTAGQLADLMALTTGTFTGILNRLEKAELVHRERDPNDGRRVIVRLERGKDEMHEVSSIFAPRGHAWDELASHYNDEQLAFLLEFLKRSNMISRQEIVQLREAPSGEGGIFSAPLEGLERGRLVVSCGSSRLTVRADDAMAELYQAHFEGPVPSVAVKDGVVTIRYPRRLLVLGRGKGAAEVALSVAIPWWIVIQGGAAEITTKLGGLDLAGLEIKGGVSTICLELPAPRGVVPIRISGGASEITVRLPTGVAARAHLKGWVSTFIFDEQTFSDLGNNVWLQSSSFDPTASYYDIEVASSASTVTITST
jgi:DNA-binding MarR family transcriptional regulator